MTISGGGTRLSDNEPRLNDNGLTNITAGSLYLTTKTAAISRIISEIIMPGHDPGAVGYEVQLLNTISAQGVISNGLKRSMPHPLKSLVFLVASVIP